MNLRYRYDDGLEFLQYCNNEELEYLVALYKIEAKTTETITKEEEYKKYYPNHKKYWKLIAAELQYFGGNSIINFHRKSGILYKEIIQDLCISESINYDKNADVAQIEKILIFGIFQKNIENMKEEEFQNLQNDCRILDIEELKALNELRKVFFSDGDFLKNISGSLGKLLSKQVVKQVVPFVAEKFIYHGFYPANIALYIKEIADPALRITLPGVMYIAYLREKYKEKDLKFRHRFYPKIGSILRSELVKTIDHSGICVGDNEIIEIFNDGGTAMVKNVTYDEFVSGSSLRTGNTVYIAVDRLSKEIIYDIKIVQNALKHLGKQQKYKLTKDNCHSFVHKCIIDEEFYKEVDVIRFQELTQSICTNLNNEKSVEWVVCDINPVEYKKVKIWKIEDEVV